MEAEAVRTCLEERTGKHQKVGGADEAGSREGQWEMRPRAKTAPGYSGPLAGTALRGTSEMRARFRVVTGEVVAELVPKILSQKNT